MSHDVQPSSPDAPAGPSWEASVASSGVVGLRRWGVGSAIAVAVTVSALIPQLLMGRPRENVAVRVVYLGLEMSLLMLVLSLHYVWASHRRAATSRMLLTSLGLGVTTGALFAVLFRLATKNMHLPRVLPSHEVTLLGQAAFGGMIGVFHCGIWALAFVYPFAAEDARLRSLEAQKLRLEAAQLRTTAELARLRAQLEPHFLLNTLNAIAGLVTQDAKEARRLIACLGDLLRDALSDPEEMQTLDQEIAWLQRYAQILESRHSGSLRFQWEISSEAGQVLLPRLLLQPLVENAVKHGALRRSGGGEVIVRARVVPGEGPLPRVLCTVEDNGPGMPSEAPRAGAFGLRAVRRRLELKYADASLKLETSPAGTRWIVELPRIVDSAPRAAAFGVS